jgi:lipoprotein-anchoring transpeptidase ErfK/SrfK
VYGCCLLALSGHQPIVRPGWAGGARIAIHGSPSQLVGEAASAGCLRARNEDLRYLMKRIVLGTPVRIRA